MITLKNINLSSIDLSGIDLRGIKLGLGGRGGGSGDGFPVLPGDVTRWHFGGLTNEMMAAMDDPRIEDADGKGRFLSFKNFAWKGMSGVGGYGDENYQTFYKFTLDDYVFIASPPGVKHMNFTFRVTGLQPGNKLTLAFFGTTNTVYGTWDKDGIYTVDADIVEAGKPTYFYNGYGATRGEFTIEILPLYPGALVFDGVDDYGTCENFPILTKEKGYTVVALRQWISMGEGISGLVSNVKNWFNDGAFILEYNSNNATNKFVNRPVSFGNVNIEMDLPNNFTYQTSKSYKGVPITTGSFKGTNSLFVGKLNNIIGNCSNVAIWELIILDHDATEEELTKIKNYFIKTYPWLFFDQAWTVVGKSNEDTDRATIANITGNGNDLVLSNFGFAGNSGYGEYAYNWNKWGINNGVATNVSKQYNKFVAVMPVNQSISTCSLYSPEVSIGTKFQFKLKITGLTTNWTVRVMEGYTGDSNIIYEFDKDGTYQIDHTMTGSGNQLRLYIRMYCAVPNTEGTTVTVEQIPDHEGYLVTDGVDDYVRSSNDFTLGKKFTVVGEWELLDNTTVLSGIAKNVDFFLYSNINGLSFYCKQGNLPTVFNGIKSLTAFNSEGLAYDHKWGKYVCEKTGDEAPKTTRFIIGTNNNVFAKVAFKNMAMYAEKVLSKEDMIKAYIYLQTLKAK